MSTDYRKGKRCVYGQYLTDDEAKIIDDAIDKAAKNIGVSNNRKNRLALLEIARHYNETA